MIVYAVERIIDWSGGSEVLAVFSSQAAAEALVKQLGPHDGQIVIEDYEVQE